MSTSNEVAVSTLNPDKRPGPPLEASDAALPEISVAVGTSPVTEGAAVAFTLTRTGPTTEALAESVSVTESAAMLAAHPPASVTFGAGESSVTLIAGTEDDALVKGESATLTLAIANGVTFAEDESVALSGLAGLAELALADSAVTDLGALADLAGLRRLDLSGNAVDDLRPLRAMPSLVWVHIAGAGSRTWRQSRACLS